MSKNRMLVGTAFDYLLRFEIQRRAPHALARTWAAEAAPDLLFKEVTHQHEKGRVTVRWSSLTEDELTKLAPEELDEPFGIARHARERASSVIRQAHSAVTAYLAIKSPSHAEQESLARQAIRLAKLDGVLRARAVGASTFDEPDPGDVQDLLALLDIVPFDLLLHDKVLILNPGFPDPSGLIGGSDTDLLTGDMLVDFKTTTKPEMGSRDLNQIVCYLLLAPESPALGADVP